MQATPGAESRLRIGAIEPYLVASHAYFLRHLSASSHHFEIFSLPARQWKWRVRGSALNLAPRVAAGAPFDAFLCSDFVNLPDFRALLPGGLRAKPVVYYLHENQLTYPLSPREEFDPYFGFTNVLSCLSAERVVFNSRFHKEQFLAELPGFLPRLPDYRPQQVVRDIQDKAQVVPVGLDIDELEAHRPVQQPDDAPQRLPRILWNHRWEFDKNPGRLLRAMRELLRRGAAFRLSVVGEVFQERPPAFDDLQRELGNHLEHFGRIESRQEYIALLYDSDIVLSTSDQEFFGVAIMEGVWCGAFPIAPRALVYPELYGGPGSDSRLYRNDTELVELLQRALAGDEESRRRRYEQVTMLRRRLSNFSSRNTVEQLDHIFEELARIH